MVKSSILIKFLLFSCLLLFMQMAIAKELDSLIKPKTHVLQRVDLFANFQMGMGIAEFAPNAIKDSQLQTGPEVLYVLSGELTYFAKDKPAKKIKAGESYQIPVNEIHFSKAGPDGAKVLATWVLEKGKPFTVQTE